MDITERYNELVRNGVTDTRLLKATLVVDGFTNKEIASVVPKAERKVTFRAAFYDYLTEGPRTEEEGKEFIEENGTNNDIRHLSHHLGILKLANRIRNGE